ncbi:MAG TPA: class I SAM-dependent methyltransferase [Steroidobacteraceae bacterium]|jgi:SAM-dependent methyltransferase
MASPVETHYKTVLSARYTWMLGGLDQCLRSGRDLLASVGLPDPRGGTLLDLGCGPGYHARVLAESGSRVVAVDNSSELLRELEEVCSGLPVLLVQAEITNVARYATQGPYSAVLCLGDTLTHLDSLDTVTRLFGEWRRLLVPGGMLVLEFREQPRDLQGQDAVLTLRAERDRIMQCVLHFEPERVWITDVVHEWRAGRWEVHKSTYPKLRLRADWVLEKATEAGLSVKKDEARSGRRVLVLSR